jgi:hypothetical protein
MRILLPYWLGVPERCFYQDFHAGIAAALNEFGCETVRISFADRGRVQSEESNELCKMLQTNQFNAVLDVACWGYALSRIMLRGMHGERHSIFDAFGIPYVQWLFDQPCNQQMTGILARQRYVLYPDLGHPDQIRLLYPNLEHTGVFAPPAIRPENNLSQLRWSSARDIDVLYVGNLVPQALERSWNDQTGRRWPEKFSPEFCNALADLALENADRPLHVHVQSVIADLAPMPDGFNMRFHFSEVEHFLRHTIRREAIQALAGSGVRMRLVGEGWDKVALPDNVELCAKTDYEGLFRLAGQAKICLDASTYLGGVNDRVFSYALNRAVCFTNASGYLRRVAVEHDGVRFFCMRNLSELSEQVKALLTQPASLQEAGERAAVAVLNAHTWRHRVSHILDALNLKQG